MQVLPIRLLALAALAVPSLAQAAQPSPAFQGRPELEVVSGAASRAAITTSARSPQSAARAWVQFQADLGGQWTALWDEATGVPMRIYGSGVAAPGSIADPTLAARHAGDLLKRHIQLLAPGSSATDFVLVSNEVHRGVRSVGYKQMQAGIPVIGGQVSFRFKADRLVVIGSEAMPFAKSRLGGGSVSTAALRQKASKWILSDSASQAQASSVEGPFVLPIISSAGARYHTVMAVAVAGQAPLGKWRVYLDANSGAPIAREQTLDFAEGTVRYNVPVRSPNGDRAPMPAARASLTVNGDAQESGTDGSISWDGIGDATVEVRTVGPLIEVFSQTGANAQAMIQISADGNLDWAESGNELLDAQLTSYIHAGIAKEKARELNPNLAWLDTPLPVNVNIDDACNAYSDGNSINFFVESSQCANTGRLADVVYHEFGHSMHRQSIIEGVGAFEGAFSEGLSDYLAATITNDPAMGLGFFKSNAPLRHIDPANREYVWPDDIASDVHATGLIFAGAMWDLRKLFIIQYGQEAGAELADRYFYAAVQRSSNIPATYVEILLEDDDDGNLANGTPNLCDINAAFGGHGLRTINADSGNLSVVAPTLSGYDVTLKLEGIAAECPGDGVISADVDWLLRSDRNTAGEVAMSETDGLFTGTIPQAEDGNVIRYKITVEFADGTSKTFPDNPADPRYEFYVGELDTLYCSDFETDPFTEGWTHELIAGEAAEGADDWTWGAVSGGNSGDPSQAYSGQSVIGNDLGGDNFDGSYQNNKINAVTSPKIDIGSYSDVRLQYRRWLTVEDGHFDRATIYSNGVSVWNNFDSMVDGGSLHHVDHEWRFHDVSLAGTIEDGSVQIKYELDTDQGLQFGGWTIDDFCIVANVNAVCGDEKLFGPEQCDDGDANSDTDADACRSNCLLATCGDGVIDTGEICDDGNTADGDGCESTCLPPGADTGDCGCVVGASHSQSPERGLLVLFGFLGLVFLRRRRRS